MGFVKVLNVKNFNLESDTTFLAALIDLQSSKKEFLMSSVVFLFFSLSPAFGYYMNQPFVN